MHKLLTDATIAEHIAKVIARGYVTAQKQGKTEYLLPSLLGQGLVDGYNRLDFDKSLCKPLLRRETEYRLTLICDGQRSKTETIEESIAEYRSVYLQAKGQMQTLVQSVSQRIRDGQRSAATESASRAMRDRQRTAADGTSKRYKPNPFFPCMFSALQESVPSFYSC